MNKLLKQVLIALPFLITAISCGSDDDSDGLSVIDFTVTPTTLQYTKEGGTKSISARAPQTVTAISDQTWCTVSVGEATPTLKDTPIKVTVEENKTQEARSAVVTIKAGNDSKTVSVTQEKGEATSPAPSPNPTGSIKYDAKEVAKLMSPGWNLGNTMEAGNNNDSWKSVGISTETSWQKTKTSKELISFIKAQGFKSVRIPCAWVMGHITNATDCTIDPAWMARVKEIVNYCVEADLYVVLNQHWDGGWLEHDGFTVNADVTVKKQQLSKIWTQIATSFKDYDDHVIFAGLNEPGVGGAYKDNGSNISDDRLASRLAEYEQTFIDAVRATGGNNEYRVLVVQGPETNIDKTVKHNYIASLTDKHPGRLMMEVHFYDPYQFTMMDKDASWGKMWYYWGKGNNGTASNRNANSNYTESYVSSQMAKLKTAFVDKGFPVIIGEFGANQRFTIGKDVVHDTSIRSWYEAVIKYAITNGCIPFAWDTNSGNGMTIINRSTVKVLNTNMMLGIKQGSNGSK